MKKVLLTLFIFICLMATIYSGYLLFTKQLAPITGSVLLAVGIIVLIWSWSLARKHRLSGSTAVIAIIIIALFASATGAYAGYEPLSEAKDKITSTFQNIEVAITDKEPTKLTTNIETYIVPPAGVLGDWKQMQLKTIKKWEGSESKELNFKADTTPWVVNSGYTATSPISTKFSMNVVKDIQELSDVELYYNSQFTRDGLQVVTMEEKGNFKIKVEASGCSWWVKIGVEP